MATRPWRPVERKSSWRRLALATWRAPDDPTVYGTIDVDMTNALALIDRLRTEQAVHATVTHLVARALALGIASEPSGNGLVIGRRVYQRDSVDIFLQVASEDGQDLSGFKVRGADRVGAAEIARMVQERAERVRQRKDAEVERSKASLDRIPERLLAPAMRMVSWLLYERGLDLSRFGVAFDQFGSAMVTSIGSIDAGLGMALAPIVPFSHVPIIVLVNALQRRPVVVGEEIAIRPMITLGCTFDHRFIDGVVGARIARVLRDELVSAQRLA